MINSIYIFVAILCLSCSDDFSQGNNNQPSFNVNEINSYLPSNYLVESEIVYTNSSNQELILLTDPVESEVDILHEGNTYKGESLEVTLYNPDDPDFLIVLSGNPYTPLGNSPPIDNIKRATLVVLLMPFSETGSTFNAIRFENGKPVASELDDFRSVFERNSKDFEDVFVITGMNPQGEVMTELAVNSNEGVVSF